jgi:hypothetical protein
MGGVGAKLSLNVILAMAISTLVSDGLTMAFGDYVST